MTPARYILRVHQRTARDWALTWYDENEAVIDLTGYEALFQVRQSPSSPLLGELRSDEGQIILGDTSPNIRVEMGRTFLEALPTRNQDREWSYGLKLYQPGAPDMSTITLLQDHFYIQASVPRQPDE